MQEHEKRCAKVRPPAVADRSACGRVSRGRISHADELFVHVHRPLGVAWSTPAPRVQQVVQVELVEPMSSDPAESCLVGRVDRCDAQSAKPRAGTPARDPRPGSRLLSADAPSSLIPLEHYRSTMMKS